jgi:hypothetical protein
MPRCLGWTNRSSSERCPSGSSISATRSGTAPRSHKEEPGAERDDYRQVLLPGRLRRSLERIDPDVPPAAIDEAIRVLHMTTSPTVEIENRTVHRLLADGAQVEIADPAGGAGAPRQAIGFGDPDADDWLAVNRAKAVETVLEQAEQLGWEFTEVGAAAPTADVLPFRRLNPTEAGHTRTASRSRLWRRPRWLLRLPGRRERLLGGGGGIVSSLGNACSSRRWPEIR